MDHPAWEDTYACAEATPRSCLVLPQPLPRPRLLIVVPVGPNIMSRIVLGRDPMSPSLRTLFWDTVTRPNVADPLPLTSSWEVAVGVPHAHRWLGRTGSLSGF